MGIIRRYVTWMGHDAGGTLPPMTVRAGVLDEPDSRGGPRPGSGEALVFVPPQWMGDWESGRPLPPGYQYVWVAPERALSPAHLAPPDPPYRPEALPPTATGPSQRRPAWTRGTASRRTSGEAADK